MKKSFLKMVTGILEVAVMIAGSTGCAMAEQQEPSAVINRQEVYQTIDDFGASGCWWSQDVGGWTECPEALNGLETREYIAELLYDREMGIGLTSYRYNAGAGSSEKGNSPCITDPWRSAESFETEPGVYDWDRDENAVWFLKRAAELGAERVIVFANSPLVRLTDSGNGYGDKKAEKKSNLSRENYEPFAEYLLDVTEHFAEEGIPVSAISPINEPQWDWTDSGQEGCHYDPAEVCEFLKVFGTKLAERETLEGIEMEAPELGEWGNTTFRYMDEIIADEELTGMLDSLSIHSYWSDVFAKKGFMDRMQKNGLDKKLRMSEWCEMENGRDVTMDSALNLAAQIQEDMTIQNVVSWQYWIAVSCYDYRDGLIYVDKNTHEVTIPKRLWTMGNYSRFVRPGYVRIGCTLENAMKSLLASAYAGIGADGKEQTVLVLVNKSQNPKELTLTDAGGDFSAEHMQVWLTDEEHDLEMVQEESPAAARVMLPGKSVVTIVLQ